MTYGIYPSSSPEFRMVEKPNGTFVMEVRYICSQVGYVGKWMEVKVEKQNDKTNQSSTPSYI